MKKIKKEITDKQNFFDSKAFHDINLFATLTSMSTNKHILKSEEFFFDESNYFCMVLESFQVNFSFFSVNYGKLFVNQNYSLG